MKDDISFYKATHENTSRLREEKTSLEKKLELLSLVSKELNESQVKVAMLESEKQRWLSFFTSLPEGDKLKQNPYELGRVLTQNQATIQVLNEKLERLQERSKVREDYISGLERQVRFHIDGYAKFTLTRLKTLLDSRGKGQGARCPFSIEEG